MNIIYYLCTIIRTEEATEKNRHQQTMPRYIIRLEAKRKTPYMYYSHAQSRDDAQRDALQMLKSSMYETAEIIDVRYLNIITKIEK